MGLSPEFAVGAVSRALASEFHFTGGSCVWWFGANLLSGNSAVTPQNPQEVMNGAHWPGLAKVGILLTVAQRGCHDLLRTVPALLGFPALRPYHRMRAICAVRVGTGRFPPISLKRTETGCCAWILSVVQ
ncbi:hypothetical protein GCM10027570_06310 [Streptomonospora sediminis]